jgi:hypothetical protein
VSSLPTPNKPSLGSLVSEVMMALAASIGEALRLRSEENGEPWGRGARRSLA